MAATLAIVANGFTILTPFLDLALDRLVPDFGGGKNRSISAADEKLLFTVAKAQQILDNVDYEKPYYPLLIRRLKDGIYRAQDIFDEMSICDRLQRNPVFPHLLSPDSITDVEELLNSTIEKLRPEGFGGHSQLESEDLVYQDKSLLPSSSNSDHRMGRLSHLWPIFLHLQKCFLLASIFPKSDKLEKDDLIQLWMAQGFIPNDVMKQQRLEDIGSEFLCWFVEKGIFSKSGDCYQITDDLHELAKDVSLGECLRINDGEAITDFSSCITVYLRHFSLLRKSRGSVADLASCDYLIKAKCEGLRTFLLHIESGKGIHEFCFKRLAFFKFLRVLDIRCSSITTVTDSISCLENLRYLNLSKSGIGKLPRTIRKLHRLWILKLNGCKELKDLPDLGELVSLRHLLLDKKHYLDSLPQGIGRLTELQTFSCPFVVGLRNGERIGELKNVNNLRGSLCISRLENVPSLEEASEAALHEKQYLQKLKFEWTKTVTGDFQVVLAKLKPHENLEILKLSGYRGLFFPDWVSNPSFLTHLTKVSLSNCNGCVALPAFWRLQSLKSLSLSISGTELARTLNINFGCSVFISLEILKIKNMPDMTRWVVEQAGAVDCRPFPKLRQLIFKGCPKLENLDVLHRDGDDVLLAFPELNQLTFQSCPQLRDLEFLQRLNSDCRLKIRECPLINGLHPDWQREREDKKDGSITYIRGNRFTNSLRELRRWYHWIDSISYAGGSNF